MSNSEGKFQLVMKESKICRKGSTGSIYASGEEVLNDYDLFVSSLVIQVL